MVRQMRKERLISAIQQKLLESVEAEKSAVLATTDVANTNLKAVRLLSREGTAALDRFVAELTEIERTVTGPEMIRTLTRALVAALRSQSVL